MMLLLKRMLKPGVVVHTCNPSAWEVKAGGLRVPGQPRLHSETLNSVHNILSEKANYRITCRGPQTFFTSRLLHSCL
jgi:hypothetical protein